MRKLYFVAVCAALLVASPVWGLSVSVISVGVAGTNSADSTGPKNSNVSSTETTIAGGSVADAVGANEQAQARYSANAWSDVDYSFGPPDNVINLSHVYNVSIQITADAGTTYDVAIETIFSGLMNHVDDDYFGEASARVHNSFVTLDVNGGGVAPVLSLENSDYLMSMGYYADSESFNETLGHSLTGLSGTTTLDFNVSIDSQLRSWTDDVGFLFGMAQAPTTGSEDTPISSQYGGTGRTAADDGHFLGVTATVTSVNPIPEPSTALLLGLGLVGLAVRGRRTAL